MGVTSKIRLEKVCRFYEAAGTLLLALVHALSLSLSLSLSLFPARSPLSLEEARR